MTDARTPESNDWTGRRQQPPRQTARSTTTVGAKLREAREALDLKQEWVAEQLGIPQERYSRYETGRTKRPDPEKLVALAKLFGFPDEHFLAMVGFRSGADLVARVPPEGALVIPEPRAGLPEFLAMVEKLTKADFAELINTTEFMLAQYAEGRGAADTD